MKHGVGQDTFDPQYLIVSPKTGNPFQDTTGFNKMLLKELGLSYSQMRCDRDTIAISSGKEETERISHVHGHSKKTMETHYQTALPDDPAS